MISVTAIAQIATLLEHGRGQEGGAGDGLGFHDVPARAGMRVRITSIIAGSNRAVMITGRMQATSGTMAMNPTIFKALTYDPAKELTPVALLAGVPFALLVHPSLPVHNIQDLAKVAGGGSHDRSFPDHDLAILLDGLPDVVFAYEVDWFLGSFYTVGRRRGW